MSHLACLEFILGALLGRKWAFCKPLLRTGDTMRGMGIPPLALAVARCKSLHGELLMRTVNVR